MGPRIRMILRVTIPGLIIPLPVAFYFAGTETQYHPYWQAFGVTIFGFWLLISSLSSMYFWFRKVRAALDMRNK